MIGGIGRRVQEDHLGLGRDRRRHSGHVDRERGGRVERHDLPPEKLHQRPIHHEGRLEDDHLVAGIDEGHQGQDQPAGGAAGDQQPPIGLARLGSGGRLEPILQRGNALGQRVAVSARVDRRLRSGPGPRRHGEVGLADREVDRVVEPGRQLEGLADPGGIERGGAAGDRHVSRRP